MLAIDEIVTPAMSAKGKGKNLLKPKMCPNCDESNKPESKFCSKCKFVLSYDMYNQVMEESDQQKKQMQNMNAQLQELRTDLQDTKELLQMMHKGRLNEREWHKTYEQQLIEENEIMISRRVAGSNA